MSNYTPSDRTFSENETKVTIMKLLNGKVVFVDDMDGFNYTWSPETKDNRVNEFPRIMIEGSRGAAHMFFKILGEEDDEDWCIQVSSNSVFRIPYDDTHDYYIECLVDPGGLKEMRRKLKEIMRLNPIKSDWRKIFNRFPEYKDGGELKQVFISSSGSEKKVISSLIANPDVKNLIATDEDIKSSKHENYKNIPDLLMSSKRVICIIDKDYFTKPWCISELKLANKYKHLIDLRIVNTLTTIEFKEKLNEFGLKNIPNLSTNRTRSNKELIDKLITLINDEL
jgi:hypothetical protein